MAADRVRIIDAFSLNLENCSRCIAIQATQTLKSRDFFRERVEENLVFMVPQLVAKGEIFFTTSIVKRIEATGLSANVRFVAAMD